MTSQDPSSSICHNIFLTIFRARQRLICQAFNLELSSIFGSNVLFVGNRLKISLYLIMVLIMVPSNQNKNKQQQQRQRNIKPKLSIKTDKEIKRQFKAPFENEVLPNRLQRR